MPDKRRPAIAVERLRRGKGERRAGPPVIAIVWPSWEVQHFATGRVLGTAAGDANWSCVSCAQLWQSILGPLGRRGLIDFQAVGPGKSETEMLRKRRIWSEISGRVPPVPESPRLGVLSPYSFASIPLPTQRPAAQKATAPARKTCKNVPYVPKVTSQLLSISGPLRPFAVPLLSLLNQIVPKPVFFLASTRIPRWNFARLRVTWPLP